MAMSRVKFEQTQKELEALLSPALKEVLKHKLTAYERLINYYEFQYEREVDANELALCEAFDIERIEEYYKA